MTVRVPGTTLATTSSRGAFGVTVIGQFFCMSWPTVQDSSMWMIGSAAWVGESAAVRTCSSLRPHRRPIR